MTVDSIVPRVMKFTHLVKSYLFRALRNIFHKFTCQLCLLFHVSFDNISLIYIIANHGFESAIDENHPWVTDDSSYIDPPPLLDCNLRPMCSAPSAHEEKGIFIVPYLLLHGPSVFAVSPKVPPPT